jgi:hypothetical protein
VTCSESQEHVPGYNRKRRRLKQAGDNRLTGVRRSEHSASRLSDPHDFLNRHISLQQISKHVTSSFGQ